MDKTTTEMVKMCKDIERENLEKGQRVLMKVMAIDKKNNTTMMVLPDWAPKSSNDRDMKLIALGNNLANITQELKTLVLVSDTYFAKLEEDPEKRTPIETIIYNDMDSGKRRLEDLPPELHKYRGEALIIIISTNSGEKTGLVMIPYSMKDGKVEFQKEDTRSKQLEDNMLTNVWKGYALGMTGGRR